MPSTPLGRGFELLEQHAEEAEGLAHQIGAGPALSRVMIQRGFDRNSSAISFLEPKLADLSSPDSMADRDAAAERLGDAIRRREKIVVFGDYDVDGTTSATILSEMLEALGGDVDVLCADRFEGGYGLSFAALERILHSRPSVIVTCDCGSSDHERIAAANEKGIDVIVVDHHLVPSEPLPAHSFLNPHRDDCGFMFKGLCSAGLAMVIGAAVRKRMNQPLDPKRWLDLVALGTIADLAPLTDDNRALTRAGLSAMMASDARPAVTALRELAGVRAGGSLTATDIAFRFAPLLNAPGRLGSPALTLQLLRSRTAMEAYALSKEVAALNAKRKELTALMQSEALAQVVARYGSNPTTGVVVASSSWHRGIVGITAARIAEEFKVPAAVVALEGDVGHGSVRSYGGADVHQMLSACREKLMAFGGHSAAAGFAVRTRDLDAFGDGFADSAELQNTERNEPVDVLLDERCPIPSFKDVMAIEPCGQANRLPTYVAQADLTQVRTVGEQGLHLSGTLRIGGRSLRAFAPQLGHRRKELSGRRWLVGQIVPDHYRGGSALQWLIRDFWEG
ncbi:MAG: single-stranded-DNA-specific exonuclease RecJ [Polyangiales bacterium]